MENLIKCPVCQNAHGGKIEQPHQGNVYCLECTVCGRYKLSFEGYEDELGPESGHSREWTRIRRAALSHALRTRKEFPLDTERLPVLDNMGLEEFRRSEKGLPVKLQQADNIIRYIGDHERKTGMELENPPIEFYAIIGAPGPNSACRLAIELAARGLLKLTDASTFDGPEFLKTSLTLDGWERWEKGRAGKIDSKTGFMAMQFGESALEQFLKDVIRPAVEAIPGYALSRVDDRPKAGIIDVILRQAIRESAFVIADLSHANNGAYWEAGYADGLGKPVIYICEKSKWAENRTHFDTNHCTTIIYEKENSDEFTMQLIATIKNTLDQFA